ncbi:MAG TPA: hypothetical protein ENG00_01250 [Candidatus Aenigmarchaeota archaeon]|nr:hypothetical protein [Candidatus Aenigmarchaeota archaeon]
MREAQAMLSGILEKISDRTKTLSDTEKRLGLLKKYREEVKTSEAVIVLLNQFSEAVSMTQNQLREEFLKVVNYIMNEIWTDLYPYEDFQGIRLVVDRDYILQLRESGGWVNVEGMVSGGERSIASLALRIAFSMAFIPNLKWLILDEPTHNLDSNAIERLAEVFREKIQAFADQVFIITHDERLAEGVTGSVHKLEREKESNGPTKVIAFE